MSWLNANDYLVMDAMVNARLDDLRSASGIARVDAAGVDSARGCTVVCGVRSALRTLREVRAAR